MGFLVHMLFLLIFFLGARYLFDKKDTVILDNPTVKQNYIKV